MKSINLIFFQSPNTFKNQLLSMLGNKNYEKLHSHQSLNPSLIYNSTIEGSRFIDLS